MGNNMSNNVNVVNNMSNNRGPAGSMNSTSRSRGPSGKVDIFPHCLGTIRMYNPMKGWGFLRLCDETKSAAAAKGFANVAGMGVGNGDVVGE